MWATVLARFQVMPYILTLVFYYGAPALFFLGVCQDVLGASATAWALLRAREAWAPDMPRKRKPRGLLMGRQRRLELVVRVVVLLAGACEAWLAMATLLDPLAAGVVASPHGAPDFIGYRSFAFMSTLLGGYQLFIAARRASGMTYVAVAAHHLWFFLAFRSGLVGWLAFPHNRFAQSQFTAQVTPSAMHLVAGAVLLPLALALLASRPRFH